MSESLSIKGKTVLLVDDDQDFVLQNTLRFKEAGCKVLSAGTQTEARRVFAEGKPDFVVLDMMMEEKDAGMVLAYQFKRERPTVPVLMVTGVTRATGMAFDSLDSDARSWLKADKVLAKPVRFEQLIREAEILLSRKG